MSWGKATRNALTLYLHVFKWPKDGRLTVPMQATVTRARLLAKTDFPVVVSVTAGGTVVEVGSAAARS